MTNRTCPIGLNECWKCEYRQEVNDCGYEWQDTYEFAVQEASSRALIQIERQGKPEPTLLFAGVTTAQEFQQAFLDKALGEYLYQGFSLVMDEPTLILRHEHHIVFVFGEEIRPTIEAIHTACYLHLLKERGEK